MSLTILWRQRQSWPRKVGGVLVFFMVFLLSTATAGINTAIPILAIAGHRLQLISGGLCNSFLLDLAEGITLSLLLAILLALGQHKLPSRQA